jgi:hypothetical protein
MTDPKLPQVRAVTRLGVFNAQEGSIMAKSNRSAVSAVVHNSGFDLVPKRKPRGKLATWRGIAKVDFKPWTRTPDMQPTELIPSNATLQSCALPARMAYAIMLRTKEQLIEMHGKVEHEDIDNMMDDLSNTAEKLKSIVAILDTAYTRMLVSASARMISKGKFKGVDDRPRRSTARPRAK